MARALTVTDLIDGLVSYTQVTEDQIMRAIGAARANITLNNFEMLVISHHLISDDRLLQLKGTISGYPILDDHALAVRTTLPETIARLTGSLVIEYPSLVVAMVEPTAENVEAVTSALGTHEFEIWLTTAQNFDTLYRASYQRDADAQRDAPPANVYDVMTDAVQRNATDLHLGIGRPPLIRQNGALVALNYGPLDLEWLHREMPKLMGEERLAEVSADHDLDAAFTFGSARFRVNIGADYLGPTVALRKIPVRIMSMDELRLPRAARSLTDLDRGLVLVTGPTGSGKSTTLAAMLMHVAAERQCHIITLEDPIEYMLPSGRSLVNQRELHESFASFSHGLRQALRQDPDVILVGELRDLETMRTAITAAETGHLVFATLHTIDAASAVSRLISAFPDGEQSHVRAQLSHTLRAVIAQTLLPTATTNGIVAAYEIMLVTPAIQSNLRKVDGHNQLRQVMEVSRQQGMQTMEIALVDLVRGGLVRQADAEEKAPDLEAFRRRLSVTE